jgi:hypothetical protein
VSETPYTEIVPDPDDAAYIASGRRFRVLDEEWTYVEGIPVRTIRKIERVDE